MTVTLGAGGGSSVPNWALLQTSTPSGVSTVTFSGLSGYNRYRVLIPTATAATASVLGIRINGDASSNYAAAWYGTPAGSGGTGFTQINFGNAASTQMAATVDIEHALLLCSKMVSGLIWNGVAAAQTLMGSYPTTSALTSITILNTSGANFTAGSIYLLGAN